VRLSLAYRLTTKDIVSLIIMSIFVALLFLIRGVDYLPGVSKVCDSCTQDIGPMDRAGHFEEMLWNGVRHVHNSSNDNLIQFTKQNNFLSSKKQSIENCIDCHNDGPDAKSESLGSLWVKYPRLEKETGRIIDFEKAIQYEFVKRYGGTKPFYNDVRITEIMVYAYEKARQKKLVFDVEPDNGIPISDEALADINASVTCLKLFEKLGKPKGDIAPFIVKGCNIFTDTTNNRPSGYGFWETKMNCSSCHMEGGNKEYAAHIGDGAVNYPGVYSDFNIVYTNRMRIARCYAHSINELLYGSNSEYYKLITLYMAWIAEKNGLPIGVNRQSRGIQNVRGTAARHASIMAGQRSYVDYCQKCHGAAGYGTDRFDDVPGFYPPPLNGSEAFIHSATLSYSSRVSYFIFKKNTPGATHEAPILSPQEALDIAEFIRVQTRPSAPNASNLSVFYNYLSNTAMEWWFGEKTSEANS
jgi:thiosulfate dehydrogenase